jgi:CubicO group peptidase (beta-lactamase class C family)
MQIAVLAVAVALLQLKPVAHPALDSLTHKLVGKATPAVGLVVVKGGKLVHASASGLADVTARTPFTFDTPIYAASLGKMFTAFGVLKLVDEGRLSLDDKITAVLPQAPAYARNVSIRHMLTHTSGLVDHSDIAGDDRAYSIRDVLDILNKADSLKFQPGEKTAYSNSAYILLARVIERVTGKSYSAYIRETFFKPAGMKSAVVIDGPASLPRVRARGYDVGPNGFTLDDYLVTENTANGAGAVYLTMNDLYNWGMAVRSGKFLKPETLELASKATIKNNGKPTEWGMGWLAEFHGKRDAELAGKWYVASVGILKGFRALFKWYQQDDLMMIWVANTNSNDVMDTFEAVPRLMLRPGM